jgi:hypothetical protein
MTRSTLNRINLLWTLAWLTMLLCGCTTSWVTEAQNIITLLGPAISSALAILSAFGVGLSPTVATAFTTWSQSAITGLGEVKTMLDEYNAAAATAKPGILAEIQTALSVIADNLTAILPTIKITDPKTQAEVLAVIQAVASEISALITLVPAVTAAEKSAGKMSLAELEKAVKDSHLKLSHEFKSDFNAKVALLGPTAKQYEI